MSLVTYSRHLAGVLVVVSLTPAAAVAQKTPLAGLDRYVEQAMRAWQVPGLAIAVVRNDSVIFARGYGVRELGKSERIDEHTVFAVASTTKAFTAALIGMLVDEKKVRWDDPVAVHYPGFRLKDAYATHETTLRDMLSHRTGLPRGDRLWYLSPYDRAEVVRRLRFLEPNTSFRSAYGYQNIMFLTAGQVIEAVTKQTWDDALQQRLLGPLGMRRSSTAVTALAALDNVARPHDRIDGTVTPIRWPNYDNLAGAGALNSSALDLAQWIRLQLARGSYRGTRVLSDSVVKEMQTPQTIIRMSREAEEMFPEVHFMAYGLGWSLRDYHGRKLVGHGGALDGMRTEILMSPADGVGVAVLTNLDGTSLPNAIAYRMLDMLVLGKPGRDWSQVYLDAHRKARMRADSIEQKNLADRVTGTQPRHQLAEYAGTYADSLYGAVEVSAQDNRLVFRMGPHFAGDAAHWHFDTFRISWRDTALGRQFATFNFDAKGKPAELRLEGLGVFRR